MAIANKYGVFSDESRITNSRFRSIAAISLKADSVLDINEAIRSKLGDSDVEEFKWHRLRGAKYRFAAIHLINLVFDALLPEGGRIDVVTWDTHDVRHNVHGRDDSKNFERMFFHLHKNLMSRREHGAEWHLRPDEKLDVDWKTLHECLGNSGRMKKYFETPILHASFSERFFEVRSLKEVVSIESPMVQVADLFAGMAPYSREKAKTIKQLIREETGQQSLFECRTHVKCSNRDRERYPVLAHLSSKCKKAKLGVSLETDGYLSSADPKGPLNFWNYVPQHFKDKAPTRDLA